MGHGGSWVQHAHVRYRVGVLTQICWRGNVIVTLLAEMMEQSRIPLPSSTPDVVVSAMLGIVVCTVSEVCFAETATSGCGLEKKLFHKCLTECVVMPINCERQGFDASPPPLYTGPVLLRSTHVEPLASRPTNGPMLALCCHTHVLGRCAQVPDSKASTLPNHRCARDEGTSAGAGTLPVHR